MKSKPLLVLLILLSSAMIVSSQRRDFLTEEEVELVRDAQQIDQRINVLTYAIDRRFGVLGIAVGGTAPDKKDKDKWGPLPLGTRLELLTDINRLLQKAVDDIDNLAERPDSMLIEEPEQGKKPKSFKEIFPAAVRNLAAAANRYKPVAAKELETASERGETAVLTNIGDLCEQIIASVQKLK